MARKKKHPEHVNHERWLVSYADFITLLFAFFVVMFAVSQVDSKKMGRFSESFAKAVGVELMPGGQTMLPSEPADLPSPKPKGMGEGSLTPELKHLLEELKVRTKRDANLAELQVVVREHELVIRLPDNVVFDSGDDKVKEGAKTVLSAIAATLRGNLVHLRVEGHTDNRPISTFRFRSNWELSTARATSVIAELAKDKVEPTMLSAAGYGEFHPIATNDTPAGRALNRRVDLVITTAPANLNDGNSTTLGALANADADGGVSDAAVDANEPKDASEREGSAEAHGEHEEGATPEGKKADDHHAEPDKKEPDKKEPDKKGHEPE